LLLVVPGIVGWNLIRVAVARSMRRIPRRELPRREICARGRDPLFQFVDIETEFLRFVLSLFHELSL